MGCCLQRHSFTRTPSKNEYQFAIHPYYPVFYHTQMTSAIKDFYKGTFKLLLESPTGVVSPVLLPDRHLSGLHRARITGIHDIKLLPKCRGNYWIVTNEPIQHAFHNQNTLRYPQPLLSDDGSTYEIVYNGITDNIQARMQQHLFRKKISNNPSGISVDLIQTPKYSLSHTKKLLSSTKSKVPYAFGQKIISDIVPKLAFSAEENEFVHDCITNGADVFFKNGIDVTEPKHAPNEWWVYFLEVADKILNEHIEQKWRELHGLPKLCTYSSGR